MNLIAIFMTCTCIVMHSLFCQLPNFNLFTQHVIYLYGETTLVNCGPQSILLHLYYHLLQALFTFHKYYFTALQTNIFFHTICLILCFQQTSEIDNLTVSWGKVFWLCCVQVPRCWLIRLKRIYNFWCSMLVYTPFALCFVTLRGIFIHFPELTY
jgi:hypothetical protein